MIRITGLVGILAGLAAAQAEIERAEYEGLREGAEEIRGAWVDNIESAGLVATGRYRDSVTVSTDGDEATVHSEVPYSPILEWGDSRQQAHHVATRAFDEHQHEAIEAVGHRIEAAIR